MRFEHYSRRLYHVGSKGQSERYWEVLCKPRQNRVGGVGPVLLRKALFSNQDPSEFLGKKKRGVDLGKRSAKRELNNFFRQSFKFDISGRKEPSWLWGFWFNWHLFLEGRQFTQTRVTLRRESLGIRDTNRCSCGGGLSYHSPLVGSFHPG